MSLIETGVVPAATPHTLTDVRATTGEYVAAHVPALLNTGGLGTIFNFAERQAAGGRALPDPAAGVYGWAGLPEPETNFARAVPMTSAEDANKQYADIGLKFDAPIATAEAELIAESKRKEHRANAIFTAARASAFDGDGLGAGRATLSVATDLLGSALDPINLASSVIPFVGPAGRAALASRMGFTGAGFAAGAIEGVAGNALLEPLIAGGALAEQRDYHWYDSVSNILLGGAIGGGIGGVTGFLGRHSPLATGAGAGPGGAGGPRAGGPPSPSGGPPAAPHGPTFEPYAAGWQAALEQTGRTAPADLAEWAALPLWNREAPMVRALDAIAPETRRVAGEVATMQYLNGRPIDIEPVLRLDAGWRSPAADPVERLRLQVDQRRVAGLLSGPSAPVAAASSDGMPSLASSPATGSRAMNRSAASAVVDGSQALPDQTSSRPPPSGLAATLAALPSSERIRGPIKEPLVARFRDLGDIDKASNRKIMQPSADLNEMRALAAAGLPDVEKSLRAIAADVPGSEFVGARAKGEANLLDKLQRKPQPLNTIPDWVGARVTVATPAAAERFLERIGQDHKVIDLENFLDAPKKGGYRAIHLQMVLANGMSAEVQIVPAPIMRVFHDAHETYAKWRSVTDYTDEMVADQRREMAASEASFATAYADWLGAGGGRYRDFAPGELAVDAKRFQFKGDANQAGVSSRLAGVKQWDQRLAGVTIVWEDLAGHRFVVDGHQRHALAARLEQDGQKPLLHAIVLREANGESEGYARALAAFKNIAEGTGTPIDAAKILRETRGDPRLQADLENGRLPPLPPTSSLVRDASALAALPDDAFGVVAAGKVEPAHAAHVARIISEPAQQTAAIGMLAKLGPETSEQARLIVEQIRAAGFKEGETVDLFGKQDVAASLMLERAKVLEAAARNLRKDASVFRTLVERESIATEAGNVLARDANLERLTDDKLALSVLEALANRAGTLGTALNDAARALADGRSLRSVSAEFLKSVRAEAAAYKPGRAAARSSDVMGALGHDLGSLDDMRKSAAAGDTIGDPAALERQTAEASSTPKDLFGAPGKLAEAESERVSAEAMQALEAHPELKAELEAADLAAKDADLFGKAAEALAGCKTTGGS